jgi:hypothetical protein
MFASDGSYLPEVLDDGILFIVATVVGVLGPVVDVDFGDTTDQQLELTLIEDVDEIRWDELVETLDECIELLLDTFLDSPFCNKPRVRC